MSVYDPLRRKLERTRAQTIRLTLSEIEDILGRPLPPSAYKFSAWWGIESSRKAGHTQAMPGQLYQVFSVEHGRGN